MGMLDLENSVIDGVLENSQELAKDQIPVFAQIHKPINDPNLIYGAQMTITQAEGIRRGKEKMAEFCRPDESIKDLCNRVDTLKLNRASRDYETYKAMRNMPFVCTSFAQAVGGTHMSLGAVACESRSRLFSRNGICNTLCSTNNFDALNPLAMQNSEGFGCHHYKIAPSNPLGKFGHPHVVGDPSSTAKDNVAESTTCPIAGGWDWLCFRPFRQYTMGTGILLKRGNELGNTFRGWADFQLTDNIIAKTHIGHFTFWHVRVF